MLYQRGKEKTWWYRFRFGGRIIHESAKTQSKTLAREAERQRRRELEKSWNHLSGRRELPPTFEQASREYQASRLGRVSGHTAEIDKYSLSISSRYLGQPYSRTSPLRMSHAIRGSANRKRQKAGRSIWKSAC